MMMVFCTFKQSLELEAVLAKLEHIGLARSDLLAVPMDAVSGEQPGSTMQAERISTNFEVGMACATAGTVIGMSVGFVLEWGPLIWGLVYGIIGFVLGAAIRSVLTRGKGKRPRHVVDQEVTVVIHCPKERLREVRDLIEHYGAITVGLVRRT